MQATHRHELIQNPPSVDPVACAVASRQRTHQLISCCHADLPHLCPRPRPPLGSRLSEATRRLSGASQTRQCGFHPDCRATLAAAIGADAGGNPLLIVNALVPVGNGVTVTVSDSDGLTVVTQVFDIVMDETPENVVLNLAAATHTAQPVPLPVPPSPPPTPP